MPEDDKLKILIDDEEYEFDPDEYLTRSSLSHIKQWFGMELGQYWPFQGSLRVGNPDAVSCAVWLVRRKLGITPNPEPKMVGRKPGVDDFPVGATVIAPNRDPDIDPPRWVLNIDGEELTLDMDTDVMVSTLRQIRKWYPELGDFSSLYIGMLRGDPDAVACSIWLARSIHHPGEPNPAPRDMPDFSVGVVSAAPNLRDEIDEPVRSKPENPTKTSSQKAGTRTKDGSGSQEEIPTTSGTAGLQVSEDISTSKPTT